MLAVMVIMVLGMSQAEVYGGTITITNLIFHSFEMGDFFILEGTFGPKHIRNEPVMVTISEKNTDIIVHRNGIKINELGGYVQEGPGGQVWLFSGITKISSTGTIELGNNIPERLNSDTPYTIKVQYDDKFTEMDFELTSPNKKHVILTDKTPQGFQTRPEAKHFSDDDEDITRYMLVEHGSHLSDCIYNQEDYRVSTVVTYTFENVDGNNILEDQSQKGTAPPHGFFHSYAQYHFENTGRFYIHIVHDIDGAMTNSLNPYEFIIVEEHSDAAINGCSDGRQVIVKPGYSQTVCVFPGSIEKLALREWISD